jgi:hypothetical protein
MFIEPDSGARADSPVQNSLVPQLHGGALRRTDHDGPHPGRPPSAVRAALRESGYARIHILEEIADNEKTPARDRIAAIGLMLDQGMKGNVSIDDLRSAVSRTLQVIEENLEPDVAATLAAYSDRASRPCSIWIDRCRVRDRANARMGRPS